MAQGSVSSSAECLRNNFDLHQRTDCVTDNVLFLLKMSSSSTPLTGPWCCRCWCGVKHTPPRRDTELTINRRQALENEYIYYILISAFDMKKRKMIYPQALNSQVLLKFFCHAPRSTYNNINNLTLGADSIIS